ncbi:hypothetical protein SAMN05444008_108151 [Cnuella takakiae]|uniref:Uncharacterized protein n=1 Tax=Cnuella takakiae TaxID=1302690 RepID=A0A1M5BYT6_9BACT|nr:hypothetical protein SAMN05444008_108151 [Cnuella takakiae]
MAIHSHQMRNVAVKSSNHPARVLEDARHLWWALGFGCTLILRSLLAILRFRQH